MENDRKGIWDRMANRGVAEVCSQQPDGWHMLSLVNGKYIDKGLCKEDWHRHDDDLWEDCEMFGDWEDVKGKPM